MRRIDIVPALVAGMLCSAPAPAPAQAQAQDAMPWAGPATCRFALAATYAAETSEWNGACKDGFADGKGTLAWRRDGKRYTLDATFASGQASGEGKLHYPDGSVYTGTFRNAVPDGHGYFSYANGAQYEGDVRMGTRDGVGEQLYRNGNDYKGQWKQGRREGSGTLVYKLGGRYEGGWKQDKASGPGKIVYAGTPGRAAAVVDGRLPGMPATAPDGAPGRAHYTLKEDGANVGSMFRRDIARGIPVPPDAGYSELTAQQKTVVNSWFPALAPGDEPPYPLHGPGEFYNAMSRLVSRTRQQGTIYVTVTVGKDGKVVDVMAVGLDDPDVRKVVATAAGLMKYKPARCGGEPCEMGYGYNLALRMDL